MLWSCDGACPARPDLGYRPERRVALSLILLPLCLQSDPCDVPPWLQAKEALFTQSHPPSFAPLSVSARFNGGVAGAGSRVRGSWALVSLGDLATPLSLVPSPRPGNPHLLPEPPRWQDAPTLDLATDG